jgi:hypothetical protein
MKIEDAANAADVIAEDDWDTVTRTHFAKLLAVAEAAKAYTDFLASGSQDGMEKMCVNLTLQTALQELENVP